MTRRKTLSPQMCEWQLIQEKNGVPHDAFAEWERQRSSEEFSTAVVGFRLKIERMKSGLTQEDAADALGVSVGTIIAWEKGHNEISLRNAYRLMRLYRLIPHDRPEWDVPSLNALTQAPMTNY